MPNGALRPSPLAGTKRRELAALMVGPRRSEEITVSLKSSSSTYMAPTKKPQKATKKEKVFHPESRKAGQLARKQLRKFKLAGQASNRSKLHSSKGKLRHLFSFPPAYRRLLFPFAITQPTFTDFSSTLYRRSAATC